MREPDVLSDQHIGKMAKERPANSRQSDERASTNCWSSPAPQPSAEPRWSVGNARKREDTPRWSAYGQKTQPTSKRLWPRELDQVNGGASRPNSVDAAERLNAQANS